MSWASCAATSMQLNVGKHCKSTNRVLASGGSGNGNRPFVLSSSFSYLPADLFCTNFRPLYNIFTEFLAKKETNFFSVWWFYLQEGSIAYRKCLAKWVSDIFYHRRITNRYQHRWGLSVCWLHLQHTRLMLNILVRLMNPTPHPQEIINPCFLSQNVPPDCREHLTGVAVQLATQDQKKSTPVQKCIAIFNIKICYYVVLFIPFSLKLEFFAMQNFESKLFPATEEYKLPVSLVLRRKTTLQIPLCKRPTITHNDSWECH